MNTKKAVVLVLLVALLILFAMTVAIGLRDRDSGDSSFVDSLQGLKSDRFLLNTNSQGCGDQKQVVSLAPGKVCMITVAKSGRFSAPTPAALDVAGPDVVFQLEPVRGPTQKQKLENGDCAEAAIGQGGGTLSLTCLGPTAGCAIRLRQESCPLEAPG